MPEVEPTTDERASELTEAPVEAGVSAWRFRVAVLRYGKLVFRIAHALLRDREEAEDATQDAFLRYWQRGGGIEREKEWLCAVVRNGCLDRLRRNRFQPAPLGSARAHGPSMGVTGSVPAEPADERDATWHLHRAQLRLRLDDAIARLPEPQRSLIVLFDMHGFDGAACARMLGINANQVKVYLYRARRRLRRELEGTL